MIRFQFRPGHPMVRVAFTADSLAVVTAQPHTGVTVRDRFTGDTIREFPLPGVHDFLQLQVSCCSRLLCSLNAKRLDVFDLRTAATVPVLNVRLATAFATPVGRLRVGDVRDGWQVGDWELPIEADSLAQLFCTSVRRIGTSGHVIAMSPDGRGGVAVRQRGKPQLVDLNTGQTVAELSFALRRTTRPLLGFAVFSPNSERLALCNGEKIAVFDLAEFDWLNPPDAPRQLHPLCQLDRPDPTVGGTVRDKAAEHWLPPLAFTPDGRNFLTLGLRERVQLFDSTSGGVSAEWGWRMDEVKSLAVAPDGLTAVAGGRHGKLTIWDLS